MNLKNALLIMIVIVMVPEILLTAYIFGRYSINLELVQSSAGNFLSLFVYNPLFWILVIIVMIILYFALQLK